MDPALTAKPCARCGIPLTLERNPPEATHCVPCSSGNARPYQVGCSYYPSVWEILCRVPEFTRIAGAAEAAVALLPEGDEKQELFEALYDAGYQPVCPYDYPPPCDGNGGPDCRCGLVNAEIRAIKGR